MVAKSFLSHLDSDTTRQYVKQYNKNLARKIYTR